MEEAEETSRGIESEFPSRFADQIYTIGKYFNAFGGLSLNPRNPLVDGITLAKDNPTHRR